MTPIQRWAASQQGLSRTAKAVLNVLAAMANRAGTCFPSVKFLATACSISDRSVQRGVVELKTRNLVAVKPRKTAIKGQTSNLYCLLAGDVIGPVKGDMPAVPPPPANADTSPGDLPFALNNVFTISKTTNEQQVTGEFHEQAGELIFPTGVMRLERAAIGEVLKAVDAGTAQLLLDEIGGRMRVLPPVKNRVGYVRALAKRALEGSFVPEHAEAEKRLRGNMQKRQDEDAASIAPQNASRPGPEVRAKLQAARAALLARGRVS